ncbi:MAG: hypothetical protein HY553_09780 [Elusimicrobia bacterium]|nr:hypothetical protein [Elusimicrobiota bacterium]
MFQRWFWPTAFVAGGFAIVSYTICLGADALFSGLSMYRAWEPWLPGVSGLSFGSWLLGVAELVLYALYGSALLIALVKVALPREQAVHLMAHPATR